jgi:hypothetical protein
MSVDKSQPIPYTLLLPSDADALRGEQGCSTAYCPDWPDTAAISAAVSNITNSNPMTNTQKSHQRQP